MNQFGRARRHDHSCHPHPDANQPTKLMPYQQLRTLVTSLIESDGPNSDEDDEDVEDPDAAAREFDALPTTFVPMRRSVSATRPPRFRTLDGVLAELAREK